MDKRPSGCGRRHGDRAHAEKIGPACRKKPRNLRRGDFADLRFERRAVLISRQRDDRAVSAVSALDAGRLCHRLVGAAPAEQNAAAPPVRRADAVGRMEDAVLMEWIWMALAGLISGILGSMGMGGGGVLIIYLTLIAGLDQRAAQGINLILFIPCAVLALFSYVRKGLIDFRTALSAAAAGLVGALGGVFLSGWLDVVWLRRIFGVMLLFIGVRELLAKKPPPKEEKEEEEKEKRGNQSAEK